MATGRFKLALVGMAMVLMASAASAETLSIDEIIFDDVADDDEDIVVGWQIWVNGSMVTNRPEREDSIDEKEKNEGHYKIAGGLVASLPPGAQNVVVRVVIRSDDGDGNLWCDKARSPKEFCYNDSVVDMNALRAKGSLLLSKGGGGKGVYRIAVSYRAR